jgi:uncharacterized FlaG/YvyC family protein
MAGMTGVDASRPDLPMPAVSNSPKLAGQAADKAVRSLSGNVRFRIFQPTGRVYAEVVDPITQEVVKTVPPMELLKIAANLRHVVGLLVDREG